VSAALGFGILFLILGLVSASFGVYALLRGGRNGGGGGIGPIPERGVHVIAGIRMLVVGVLCLAAGAYLLWML